MPERRLKCGACVVDESKIEERFLVAAPACSRQARFATLLGMTAKSASGVESLLP
jgi:hypothetical protein